ncbi:MAG: DNA polymerase domain-containing protein [Roseiflexaceae bacterium]
MPPTTTADDSWLFGWDPTPGIVSVWANRSGRALVWQRDGARVACTEERFRPWLFAATLEDLTHVGAALVEEAAPGAERAPFHYRELDGPPEAYRYVLSAGDGRALERAITAGAAQRLGKPIKNLYDIEDNYYWVGPVEQYLMATGRVYFRGLAYTDLHRLQFDLETTSLSPKSGRIFLVAVRDTQGLATVLEAPTPADEAALISDLCALIRERDPDIIENHNLFGFDLPFLHERAQELHIPLRMGRPEGPGLLDQYEEPGAFRRRKRTRYSLVGRELIDTLDAVWRHDFSARDMPGHGLKAAARYFGVAAPERTYIAGAEIFSTYLRDPETVRSYAQDDVMEVDGISQRLLGSPFALAGMAPRRYERLASAGPAMGILEPMLVRAYLRAGTALPRQNANSAAFLGNHAGGATHLFAAGVAQQVVKADIASMYPSIMRVFQIGPACDYLGAFLYLVDRLTDLRLQHKTAARTAAPHSVDAHQHNAVQAAMKILVNSAYGYMGAGAMALFADRPAADQVTRRGREILGHVTDALRDRGMALLEADTDGVYFAAPLGWTEQQERAVVAATAALLPDGIRLEYEGRYQAMFVHEVKNYALLTYGSDIIVRGGALRSSRSEPFGERWLREALHCTLVGNVVGVHQAFLEIVDALRNRRLTAMDVAIQARLSKTPEEYQVSRKRAREASYEALLTAGRTSWQVGERVRFFKAADGTVVWLPETRDDLSGATEGEETDEEDDGLRTEESHENAVARNDYDVEHYIHVLLTSYVGRLRKAFSREDFDQMFRPDTQLGLFDRPIEAIQPLWIRCEEQTNAGLVKE